MLPNEVTNVNLLHYYHSLLLIKRFFAILHHSIIHNQSYETRRSVIISPCFILFCIEIAEFLKYKYWFKS